MVSLNAPLTCRSCGLEHRPTLLQPGERALCARCDSLLFRGARTGSHTALAFAVTGLALALPAILLPFIGAGISGNERVSLLFTGVHRLWEGGMRSLAALVFLCGGLLPVALLGILAMLHAPARWRWHRIRRPLLEQAARLLGHWTMPEVQVLAVLVALMKLGSVVNITIGPGFWCYCAMALSLLIAQHCSESNLLAAHIPAGVPATSSPS